MSSPILFSYALNGPHTAQKLAGATIAELLEAKDLAWVHLDATHTDAKSWLHQNLSYLDPFIADALSAEETRPRTTRIGDGALLIFRGVNFNDGAKKEDMISVRLWVDQNRIISVRRRKSKSIEKLAETISNGDGPKTAGAFVADLAALLSSHLSNVLVELDDMVDGLEEMLLAGGDTEMRHSIVDARRKTILFRRFLAPQKEAIQNLRDAGLPWLEETDKRNLTESFHTVQRTVEDLDAIRERAQIVKEELASVLSDKMNHNMYVLSVIAAIFLPLGFLTGLLGINIGGMPGAENPNAFWLFSGGLILLVALQIWLFRKMRWF